ncbi:MAG: T9SS type A sorting domain-containing protein [Bacteroidota bacterium]|jgi:hypothetical protein
MKTFLTICLILRLLHECSAQTVFSFEFNGYAGTPPPISASVGAATLTHSGLSNFAEDACTGKGFSVNSWNTGDYLQIKSSTLGFIGPFNFSYDYRMSDIDLGNFEIQVSSDGANFSKIGDLNATAPTTGCNGSGPMILGSNYNNLPNIYFRFYKKNDAVTALNRLRLDNIMLKASAVPVEISNFRTQVSDNQKVNVRWETISEINSNYFMVERSRDAFNYQTIANIEAAGSSQTKKAYSFTDETALFGTNYYRLKQIDKDGTQQVFRPQAVIIDDTDVPFGVFPNPVIGAKFNVKVEDSDEAKLLLMDFEGNEIKLNSDKITQTILEIMPLQSLKIGAYLLQVQTLGSLKRHKILVLK